MTETASSAPLTIVSAGDDLAVAWDAFVGSRPEGSFYHLYGWRKLNESEFGHRCEYLIARDARGAIRGVLPLVFVETRIFGRILCSVPFMNYGGPIATSAEVATQLTAHAAELANRLGADYLELRCAQPLTTTLPVSLRKVSMTVALDANPDVLWEAFGTKHRKDVKRAQKNDLPVRIGGLEKSWQALGTPLHRHNYFRRVLETFPNNTHTYICHHMGRAAAVALVGHFNGAVEGLYWYFRRPPGGEMPRFNVDNPKYRRAIDAWRKLPLWATRVVGPRLARGIA